MARRRTFGLSFSLKRALGISAAKSRISRIIGIPLTRSGRQRKLGRQIEKGLGCCLSIAVTLLSLFAIGVLMHILPVRAWGREWTESTGRRRVEADFLGIEDDNISLKRVDGSTWKVPLDRLMEADREYARKLQSSATVTLNNADSIECIPLQKTETTLVVLENFNVLYVGGYYRKDGTYVHSHTRSAPGSGHSGRH